MFEPYIFLAATWAVDGFGPLLALGLCVPLAALAMMTRRLIR